MIDVTLYGKQSSVYQYLKMHMQDLAQKAGIDLAITEVSDTKRFIDESIMSIPAVKLNEETKEIGRKPINTFINEVNQWVLSKANYGNLRKIHVPIDFSDYSLNAAKYAKQLGMVTSSVVNLVHCYHPTSVVVNEVVYIDPEIEKLKRANLENHKEQLSAEDKIDSSNSVIIDSEFINGFAGTELIKISEEQENMMIIMGSRGEDNSKKLFGSVSTKLALKAKCPVMIVPDGCKFKPYRKIAFCANDLDLDASVVEELVNFAAPFNADIEVLHVDQLDAYQELELKKVITNFYPKNKVSFKILSGSSKAKAILDAVDNNNIDLLVMSKTSKGLLGDLFHRSLTKKIASKTSSPLLILHK